MEVLFVMIVIQLLHDGYQTFMDMTYISVGYGSDIEGGGHSLKRKIDEPLTLNFQFNAMLLRH